MKTRQRILAVFLAAGMTVLFGCGSPAEDIDITEENVPATEQEADPEETAEDAESLSRSAAPQVLFTREGKDWYEEESGLWALHLEYDSVRIEGEGFEAVSESVAQWSGQRVQEMLSYAENLSIEAMEVAPLAAMGGTDYYYYSVFQRLETMRADSGVVSIREWNSQYTGGAHSNYGYTGYVFDTRTGKALTLEDILTDRDTFRQDAVSYIIEELDRLYREGLNPDYESTVEQMWELDPCWYLDGAGITFVFNPYELGPYAMGHAQVTLPYERFGSYMDPAYVGVSSFGTAALPENTDVYLTLSAEDSLQTRLCVRTEAEEDYGATRITLELGDSDIETGSFERIGSACLLNLPDGRSFVVLDADYASDDYVTMIYEITGGVIKEGNRLEGVSLNDGTVNTDALILRMSLQVFGSYYGMMEYGVGENGELVQRWETFQITQNDSDVYLLTLIRELPVTRDGQTEGLPAGSRIRLTGTDDQGRAYFRVEDTGEEVSVSYVRGNGADDTWTLYVDGLPETDYFEMLPYAG